LELEYVTGIFRKDFNNQGVFTVGVPLVDKDAAIQKIDSEIADLYTECFQENSHGAALWFDKKKAHSIKGRLQVLTDQLKARLDAINDGSFVVIDHASEDIARL
ncbi:MAG: hypothetical protein LKF58_02310, partial [Bacilli bacterium]|nr:hypothetical protein [Bacilli bacterium]